MSFICSLRKNLVKFMIMNIEEVLYILSDERLKNG